MGIVPIGEGWDKGYMGGGWVEVEAEQHEEGIGC